MKIIFFLIFSLGFVLNSHADYLEDITIVDIVNGEEGEKSLVFASNGEVFEVNEQLQIEDLIDYKNNKTVLNIFTKPTKETAQIKNIVRPFSNRHEITSIGLANEFGDNLHYKNWKNSTDDFYYFQEPLRTDYQATLVDSPEAALSIFRTMRNDFRNRSQCYNRAHIWAYELNRRTRLNSTKVWIYFTSKYIREYRYKWWFHVTSAVVLKDQLEPITLDRTFLPGPKSLKDWTDNFMYNNANCPVVKRYSDYRQNQNSQSCYLMHSDMYFWQPFQLENFEKGENAPKNFRQSDIDQAYRNGLGRLGRR